MRRTSLALAVTCATLPLYGQWLDYKTPGIPRLPDGKANMTSPTPRASDGKPDLSGLWRGDTAGNAAMGKAMDAIKPQKWAAQVSEKHKLNYESDNPGTLCLPMGPEVDADIGRIVQTPSLILMLSGGTNYREIHLDGRPLPKDPNPSWMGYSVAHWEGDTLVVESNGFNDRTWLDGMGHPHTEALRLTERIRRPDFGHLEIQKTYTDPGALTEPWTVPVRFEYDVDTDQLEYVCNENERDHGHLIGKTTDDKNFPVPVELLNKYAGHYAMTIPETGQIVDFTFTVSGDRLVMSGAGPTIPVTSLSDSEFSADGATIQFVRNASGAVTHAMFSIVEGDYKAVRK